MSSRPRCQYKTIILKIMKNNFRCTITSLAILHTIFLSAAPPQLGHASIDEVVAAMSLEEKARFLIGAGMTDTIDSSNGIVGHTDLLVGGAAGVTYPIPHLGIPSIVFADGPAGVRIDSHREGDDHTYLCTHFPMGTLLSSTWNDSIVYEIGSAIGNEALEYGIDVMLAPALNIQRHPLCGRNYEYYSEDPVLSGHIAAAYVRGIQDNGVGACVKHLAANNQETNRKANESVVSQRALREIYLKGFDYVIQETQPWTLMSSYNYLNGAYTSENPELLDSLLRREWGFEGVVVSDWFGGTDAVAQMKAGNDLLQPGYNREYDELLAALKSGSLDEAIIDQNIGRVLKLIMRTPRFLGYHYSNQPALDAHASLCRKSAPEGMVLLKNQSSVLPFDKSINKVALFGNNSYDMIAGGSGSGDVNRAYNVNLSDGLLNRGAILDDNLRMMYQEHLNRERARLQREDTTFHMAVRQRPLELEISHKEIEEFAENNEAAILTIGFGAGEFADRASKSFYLDPVITNYFETVCKEFHKRGKPVVVVLNVGGVIETASWRDLPDAILCAWQSGQEGGNAIADILWGDVYPSGKLPMTFPIDFSDHASNANFPVDTDTGIIFGANTKAHSRDRKNIDYTLYEEDIYVGYRYFDTFDVDVAYPFGYGLGYTDFGYSDFNVSRQGDVYVATIAVTNIGAHSGKETVQLYYSSPDRQGHPAKELLAYSKTGELGPGQSETLEFTFGPHDFAFFDEETSAWVTPAGTYNVCAASSSRDIRATQRIEVKSERWPVKSILAPSQPLDRLKKQKSK